MKIKILTCLLLMLVIVSCKNETKKEELKEVASNIFKVTIDVKVNKDDTFHLFYTEDGTINFTEENSIWVELKGNPESQQVVFNLPENIIPTQLRIDLGINKLQENMLIKNFKMEYLGKSFEAPGVLFFKYFRPNLECTNVDKEKCIVMPILKDKDYFGPSFYPEIPLTDEIAKLVK